jgi:hypothetical protein
VACYASVLRDMAAMLEGPGTHSIEGTFLFLYASTQLLQEQFAHCQTASAVSPLLNSQIAALRRLEEHVSEHPHPRWIACRRSCELLVLALRKGTPEFFLAYKERFQKERASLPLTFSALFASAASVCPQGQDLRVSAPSYD